MAQTVSQCLTAAEDSITVITDINTNGNKSLHAGGQINEEGNAIAGSWSQADINERVQQNVDHLEIILAYDGSNDTPNIVGSSSSKKTDCTNAINTGKAYIAAN
jgi:hypothetical protein|tara:strand:+ start:365 stop:676 length:312 start_codon:yes stop_codon:yes gene_type:complete